jgi:hypothetical protein
MPDKKRFEWFIRLDNNACALCPLKGLDFGTHKKTNNLIMLSVKVRRLGGGRARPVSA